MSGMSRAYRNNATSSRVASVLVSSFAAPPDPGAQFARTLSNFAPASFQAMLKVLLLISERR